MTVQWNKSRIDINTAHEITERLKGIMEGIGFEGRFDSIGYMLDLEAVSTTVDMDWDKLLHAESEDFIHDLMGIRRHLDRETGKLKDCFMPRHARPPAPEQDPVITCAECRDDLAEDYEWHLITIRGNTLCRKCSGPCHLELIEVIKPEGAKGFEIHPNAERLNKA